MIRLVQIQDGSARHVALVEEPHLRLLAGFASIYEIAKQAAESRGSLLKLIQQQTTDDLISYDPIYKRESTARLLTPVDHPAARNQRVALFPAPA